MRRILIGLAVPGLLAVGACSDSDEGGGGSSEEFCADFQALEDQFGEDPEAASDTDQVIEALGRLDPPDDIADDFEAVLDVYSRFADIDPEDPDALEEAEALTEDVAEAEERVDTFLADECGIGTEEGDEPATDEGAGPE